MTKYVMICALAFSIIACKKQGNKNVLPADKTATENIEASVLKEGKYTYAASNGALAAVEITNNAEKKELSIKTDNIKYVLDQKETNPKETLYERNGINAKLTSDSLFIKQGETIIELSKVR